jgi:predicted small secreted protein
MLRVALLLIVTAVAACTTMRGIGESQVQLPRHSIARAERQLVVTIAENPATMRAAPGSSARSYAGLPAYQASAYTRRIIAALERDYPIEWVTGWHIELLGVHCAVFEVSDDSGRSALLERLRADRRVESAQPMNTFRASTRSTEYNDPYFSLQKSVEAMRVPQAHQWARGQGVTVAIIDTGADTAHQELAGRVRMARNFVDDDDARFRRDRHGTAVAGVIAALTNNREGIIGVAPAADLMLLKACWEERPEAPAVCNTLTLAEALAFAIQRRARVINLSLTGPSDPLLERLLVRAIEQGSVVLGASAPAMGSGERRKSFPLTVAGVIEVADAEARSNVVMSRKTHSQAAQHITRDDNDASDADLLQVASGTLGTVREGDHHPILLAAPGREVLTLSRALPFPSRW